MEVILLEKIGKLGSLGDQVSVKAGFGRNYLIPTGKAVPATADNVTKFEARRAELEKAAAEALNGFNVTIASKAGDEGKLFGSIGTRDIADAIVAAGQDVAKSEVRLPEGALRHTGEFEVALQLHAEVTTTITVTVVSES